uniref:Uncharacterized protein n=1 Tax=Rhizophora mucronata TaxID=61149 RepID=A0A2P2P8Q9_RHIMU
MGRNIFKCTYLVNLPLFTTKAEQLVINQNQTKLGIQTFILGRLHHTQITQKNRKKSRTLSLGH